MSLFVIQIAVSALAYRAEKDGDAISAPQVRTIIIFLHFNVESVTEGYFDLKFF